jgi:hypothetical protein
MPDELLAGQDTPASSEAQTTAPAQTMAGTDAAGAETAGAEKQTPNEPKTYSEEELAERIERATAKAAAKAERRALREATERLNRAAQFQQQPAQPQGDGRPQRAQFADEEAYFDALTDWKLEQRDGRERQAKQQEQVQKVAQKTERLYAEAEKIPGFDRDDFESLPLTPVIAQAITDSDVAPKLMAHLAQHPEEVSRIGALPPARQAVEIGKLEVKLTTTAKPPKAPAPIDPVGGGASPVKSLQNMSPQEYYEARLKQRPNWAR